MQPAGCLHEIGPSHLGDETEGEAAVAVVPQRHVQHGAIFRKIDLLATEHGLDPPVQAGGPGQPDEQLDRLVGDAILGIVQIEAGGLNRETPATSWVGREDLLQVSLPQTLGWEGQRSPAGLGVRGLIGVATDFIAFAGSGVRSRRALQRVALFPDYGQQFSPRLHE